MASEHAIPVNAGRQRYEVIIRRGLLDAVGEHVSGLTGAALAAIVTDANVAAIYLDRLRRSLLAADISSIQLGIPAGEESKSLASLSWVYDVLLAHGIERSTPVIALGGGVVTDLAGFAAATLLRGLPFIPVPTSLLAMIDAAVGGKTGVNHAAGKNLIGAFHQPAAVLIDPDVLHTLPPAELRNGLAEVIKHYVIRDAQGFARLEARIGHALRPDIGFLSGVIAENVAIKARIVEADPLEHGQRAHLNFGHTFAHALEKASDYAIPHGQAVALGMCAAMQASVAMGLADELSRDRVVSLLRAAHLPTTTSRVEVKAATDAMRADKKVREGKLRFVLCDAIGSAVVRDDVPERVVMEALNFIGVCDRN